MAMNNSGSAFDKAGKEYWEQNWQTAALPRDVRPERDTLRNHSYHHLHQFFSKYLVHDPDKRLIEFGCAQSVWLPYFARHFGFNVTGIDYSPLGCKTASAVLARAGVKGHIVFGDFLNPPDELLGCYDVAVSFGVAEHFTNTADCLLAFRRFLKPGGCLITMIPNLVGAAGFLQQHLDRRVYDLHVVLDVDALADAHRRAQMDVLDCCYVVCSNFGVLTLDRQVSPLHSLRRFVKLGLLGISALTWAIDRYALSIRSSRFLSPYIICIARA
jgi:2-polyprenyl-3-methyl-5-hydroxy-6-metoxy-1,4-benzoquinol methylase